ncbi:MAG TPA: hypothetical protein VJ550_16920 [Geomonas sp.]|nr:hypothetical protein [Geomonas sp.]
MVLSIAVFAACSSGGGSIGGGPVVSNKMAVSGVVSFPASTDMVGAKRARTTIVDTSITVEAYTLDGVLVASVHPSYNDATRIYSYSIQDLPPNADYILKVKKGSQVLLKKLIGKAQAAAGILSGQTIDAVSTTAVMIASQKVSTANSLTIILGDALPTGTTLASLSAAIDASIKPALLEQTITAAVAGSSSNVTSSTAGFANLLNLVIGAVIENKDPAAVLAGHETLTGGVPIFVVSGNTVTPPSTDPSTWQVPSYSEIVIILTDSAQGYTPPTNTAKAYDDLAAQYLAAQDIANANLNYEKALSIDPNDKEANFGGAITSGIMLIQDADVTTVVNKWGVVLPTASQVVQGASPIKVPFANMTSLPVSSNVALRAAKSTVQGSSEGSNAQKALYAFKLLRSKLPQQKTGLIPLAKQYAMAPASAPTVSEMQAVIDNVIIPRINTILARLAKIEGQGYSFTVTAAMQGNPLYGTPVVLSDPEFYTLDAALNLFQTLFRVATSYNFDLPSGYTYDTISQDPLAMVNDPSVFTLKSNGAAKMNAALLNARAAIAKAGNAYDAVKSRPAGVGAFDISNWSAADRTDFTNALSQLSAGLAGPVNLNIGNRSVTIDATKLFTNPLTRNNLPTFRYDVPRDAALSAKYGKPVAAEKSYQVQVYYPGGPVMQTVTYPVGCDLVASSDLPDYTLNGILPGNGAGNNVAGFNAILPVVDGKVISGTLAPAMSGYTTDGTFIYYLGYSNPAYALNKLDPATGTTSKVADVNLSNGNPNSYPIFNSTIILNGSFYTVMNTWNSTSQVYEAALYKVDSTTTPWTVSTAPTAPLSSSNNTWVTAVAVSGSDVYYILNTFDLMTYSNRSDFYKMSGVAAGSPASTLLFSSSADSSYMKLAVSGNYLFTNSDNTGLVKWDLTGNTVASYATTGLDWSVLMGSNFYGVNDSKVIEYGAVPAGGAQQLATLLRRLF